MANDVLISKINELNEERKELKARLGEIDELINQAIEVLLSQDQPELDLEGKEPKVQRVISR